MSRCNTGKSAAAIFVRLSYNYPNTTYPYHIHQTISPVMRPLLLLDDKRCAFPLPCTVMCVSVCVFVSYYYGPMLCTMPACSCSCSEKESGREWAECVSADMSARGRDTFQLTLVCVPCSHETLTLRANAVRNAQNIYLLFVHFFFIFW